MINDKEVVISVRGGVAYVEKIPKHVELFIVDYDNNEPSVGRYHWKTINEVDPETLRAINVAGFILEEVD